VLLQFLQGSRVPLLGDPDVTVGRGVECKMLSLAYGYCVLDLRLPAGAVRVIAPAACASAPRSVAFFNLCVAVTGAGLDTIRVVRDQVVDVVVEIRVSLPVMAPVAVLLVQVLVRPEPRCGECVQ
jgi:hypothetical protein